MLHMFNVHRFCKEDDLLAHISKLEAVFLPSQTSQMVLRHKFLISAAINDILLEKDIFK